MRRRAAPHLIVLAGGTGERVAHISRRLYGEAVPKQYCQYGAPSSLLQATMDRFTGFLPDSSRTVVATAHYGELAHRQLRAYAPLNLLVQPVDRGTATGLLIPVLEVATQDADGVVVVTPADHAFSAVEPLRQSVMRAVAAVHDHRRRVVLIGAEADGTRPGLGWIVPGAVDLDTTLRRVDGFEEKPDERRASALLKRGGAYNTLIVVARIRSLLALFMRNTPGLHHVLVRYMLLPRHRRQAELESLYDEIRSRDLSRDVLAVADRDDLLMCPLHASAGWSDLGSEESLLRWMAGFGSGLSAIAQGSGQALDVGAQQEGMRARRAALEH